MWTISKPSNATSIMIFRTSLKSEADVRKAEPFLNQQSGIKRWTIDLDDWEKVLKVEAQGLDLIDIELLMARLGFKCSELNH